MIEPITGANERQRGLRNDRVALNLSARSRDQAGYIF